MIDFARIVMVTENKPFRPIDFPKLSHYRVTQNETLRPSLVVIANISNPVQLLLKE